MNTNKSILWRGAVDYSGIIYDHFTTLNMKGAEVYID